MSRQKLRKIYVLLLAAAMIVSFMGCGNSNKKSNKTMRVGVVTYTADDPFINAMVEKVKSNLKTMETTNMNVIVSVRSGDNDQREQDEIVDEMIDAGCDVLCVNLVDRTAPANIMTAAAAQLLSHRFFAIFRSRCRYLISASVCVRASMLFTAFLYCSSISFS